MAALAEAPAAPMPHSRVAACLHIAEDQLCNKCGALPGWFGFRGLGIRLRAHKQRCARRALPALAEANDEAAVAAAAREAAAEPKKTKSDGCEPSSSAMRPASSAEEPSPEPTASSSDKNVQEGSTVGQVPSSFIAGGDADAASDAEEHESAEEAPSSDGEDDAVPELVEPVTVKSEARLALRLAYRSAAAAATAAVGEGAMRRTTSAKSCSRCFRSYSGFGATCATCRTQTKRRGSVTQCRGCGGFFWGFGSACEDCVESAV